MANPAGMITAADIKKYRCVNCGEQFNSQRPLREIRCPACKRREIEPKGTN